MENRAVIFLGKSGAGKGTQAQLLKKTFEERNPEKPVLYIEVGKKFRDLAERGLHTSDLLRKVIEGGTLAPEFLPVWAWGNSLVEGYTGEENIVFDGGARRLEEAKMMDDAIQFYGIPIEVVLIDVSNKWSTERLKERGRSDDEADDIKKRLEWFDTEVKPVIDFFENEAVCKCRFHKVNGEQTIEEVHEAVVASLFNQD